MPIDETTPKRGGARPGAGRPRTGSKLITFRVPEHMALHIDSQPSKSDYIKRCIELVMNREPDFAQMGEVVRASNVRDMKLPFFDIKIVAGFPIPLDNDERAQHIDFLRMLCPYPESCYLIRVQGDSMIDADIHSGDIVIVDKSNRNPSPSEVAVCELNGEYTLKRFERRGDSGWLIPANPAYPEIEITPDDDFSIWGVVTFVIHKPKA